MFGSCPFRVRFDALTGFQPVFHRMLLTVTGAPGALEQMPQIQEQIVLVRSSATLVQASGDSTGGHAQIEQIVDVPGTTDPGADC